MVLSASSVDGVRWPTARVRRRPAGSSWLVGAGRRAGDVRGASRLPVGRLPPARLAGAARRRRPAARWCSCRASGGSVNGATRWIGVGSLSVQPLRAGQAALALWGADLLARKERCLGDRLTCSCRCCPVVALIGAGHRSSRTWARRSCAGHRRSRRCCGPAARRLAAVRRPARRRRRRRRRAWRVLAPYRAGAAHRRSCNPCADPHAAAASRPCQGMYALASGGWFGRRARRQREKWGYLPNASHRLHLRDHRRGAGVARRLVVICLFGLLAYAGLRIARRSPDPFVQLAARRSPPGWSGRRVVNMGAVVGLAADHRHPAAADLARRHRAGADAVHVGMLLRFARSSPPPPRRWAPRTQPAGALAGAGAARPSTRSGPGAPRPGGRARAWRRAPRCPGPPGARGDRPAGQRRAGRRGHRRATSSPRSPSPTRCVGCGAGRIRSPALGTARGLETTLVPARGYELRARSRRCRCRAAHRGPARVPGGCARSVRPDPGSVLDARRRRRRRRVRRLRRAAGLPRRPAGRHVPDRGARGQRACRGSPTGSAPGYAARVAVSRRRRRSLPHAELVGMPLRRVDHRRSTAPRCGPRRAPRFGLDPRPRRPCWCPAARRAPRSAQRRVAAGGRRARRAPASQVLHAHGPKNTDVERARPAAGRRRLRRRGLPRADGPRLRRRRPGALPGGRDDRAPSSRRSGCPRSTCRCRSATASSGSTRCRWSRPAAG